MAKRTDGVDVPRGWRHLVEQCDSQIRLIAPKYILSEAVKKWGGLWFTAENPRDPYGQPLYQPMVWLKVLAIAEEYEAASRRICEDCGDNAVMDEDADEDEPILCDECRNARNGGR